MPTVFAFAALPLMALLLMAVSRLEASLDPSREPTSTPPPLPPQSSSPPVGS